MTKTLTLTEFLLARIAEDENVAQCAGHGCGYLHEHNAGWVEVTLPDEHNARPSYEMHFIKHNSPARVLAECEAKRRRIEVFAQWDRLCSPDDWPEGDMSGAALADAGRFLLRNEAAVHVDHPDYREEWRP